MGGNVKSLFGGPVPASDPNEECVKTLERWLDMARSGEIVGVAMAGLCPDGCGRYVIGGYVGGYSMLGALDVVKAEMIDVVRG